MSDFAIPIFSTEPLVAHRSATDREVRIVSLLLLALVVLPHFSLRSNLEDVSYGLIDAQLLLRLGLCALCGLYGLANLSRVMALLNCFPLAWMLLLAAVTVATVPLAVDPRAALSSSAVLWSMLLFVPAALLKLGTRRTLRVILLGSAVYLIGQWLLYFLAPEYGQGVELLPNGDAIYRVGADSQQLGFQSVVTVGLALILLRRGQLSARWHWILLALATVTLLGARSRTAAIAVIVAASAVLVRRLSPARRALLVGGGAVAVCLAYLLLSSGFSAAHFENVEASLARSGNSEEIESFTGRSDIWHFVWKKIEQKPILGWGYCCSIAASQELDPFLRHAHNEVLNGALGLGIVGTIPLLGMFLQQLLGIWRTVDELPLFVTMATIIAGMTEPVLFITMPTVLLILWIVVLCRQEHDLPSPGRLLDVNPAQSETSR